MLFYFFLFHSIGFFFHMFIRTVSGYVLMTFCIETNYNSLFQKQQRHEMINTLLQIDPLLGCDRLLNLVQSSTFMILLNKKITHCFFFFLRLFVWKWAHFKHHEPFKNVYTLQFTGKKKFVYSEIESKLDKQMPLLQSNHFFPSLIYAILFKMGRTD